MRKCVGGQRIHGCYSYEFKSIFGVHGVNEVVFRESYSIFRSIRKLGAKPQKVL